jgi:hypothetical protein
MHFVIHLTFVQAAELSRLSNEALMAVADAQAHGVTEGPLMRFAKVKFIDIVISYIILYGQVFVTSNMFVPSIAEYE